MIDQTQDEGDNALFACQATGEPVPTISWYFNGAPVNEANTLKYTIEMISLNTTTISNTLTIMSVESSDVGTYTCNATNRVSTDTSSGILTVNGMCVCVKSNNFPIVTVLLLSDMLAQSPRVLKNLSCSC